LTWDVAPLNSAHYSIGKSGNNVILHYNLSLVPSGTGVASPNSVVHNQPVLITVTVTFSSNPINTVTVDASALGASSSLPLISAGGGNYTNTVVVATSTALGTKTLVATMTDSGSLVGTTPSFTVTVNTSSEVWNGGGANNLWSSNPNWQSGYAPGYVGDSLTFAGTTRLTPDMNASYTISTLTFGTAGSFTLGSSGGYGLTITGGSIANNSANTQTLSVAVANAGNLLDVSGNNNIVFNGGIAGAGGLQNDNSGALILNGTNTFTGGIDIENGTLQIAGAGLLGGTNGNYSGNIINYGIFQYSSSATQTLAGVISSHGPIKDGTGKLILTGNNTYFYDTVVSNGVLQIAGAGGLGYGSQGNGSTLDVYVGNLFVNGTFEYSSSAAQTIANAITGTGGVLLDGPGTLTLNGANTYSGPTVVTGGTLVYSPNTFTYPMINSLSISNGTVLVNVNKGASLPVGNLTLNSNSVLNLSYNFSGGNPTAAALGVTNISAPGTNILIRIIGFGAAVGQFPLISYTGTPLANLNRFILALPPGVTGNLVNNTGSKTIDVNIAGSSPATWIPLNAGDAVGTSSFTNSGHWADGNPPTSGNGYYTQNYLLRMPADTNNNNYTFGGSALAIDQYLFDTTEGRFLLKGGGGTITVTNLILDGGLVDYANSGGDNGIETLAGNITLNGGVTSFIGALGGETLLLTASISGTGNPQFGGANVNGGGDTGVIALSGANTYSGSTTIATGTLLANGTAPNTSVTVLTNATLGGTNSIGGAVTVQAGGTLAPGIAALTTMWTNTIGTLTVGGAVSVSGAVVIKINDGVSPKSDKLVAPSVTISSGATLTVNNIGSTNLVAGDTFTLFSTPVSGSFTTVTLPALPATNLAWTNKLAVNGSIGVVAVATVNTSPTNITFTVSSGSPVSSGNQLILSWPADHIGWHLQAQTNSLSTGLGTNWVTIPGTDTVGSYTNTINPANGCVFYRQVYP
jgi:autotransporter-associated beta strand protein